MQTKKRRSLKGYQHSNSNRYLLSYRVLHRIGLRNSLNTLSLTFQDQIPFTFQFPVSPRSEMSLMVRSLELCLLSVLMGITSFIAGMAPLKLPLSTAHLNLVSMLSMGMLIGTSLVIVIPEGIETLYDSIKDHEEAPIPRYIGISLILGFMTMFIIDNCSSILENFNINYNLSSDKVNFDSILEKVKSIFKSPLTLGLILHSAVDGISLGSSFSKEDTSLGIIFFVMIIIHKLPTAFSLTTLLFKEGLPQSLLQLHLAVFSLITPVTSVVTYFILLALDMDNEFTISIMLLYSGGTFIYIVTHVMLEILTGERENQYRPPQSSDSDSTIHEHAKITGSELGISLLGMLVPIFMSFLGGHH